MKQPHKRRITMLRYALIGFGALGRMHLSNLHKINKELGELELCAICGTTAKDFNKSVNLNLGTVDCSEIDITNVHFYDDYKEMLVKEKLDFAVSALPTYLHEEVAVFALENNVSILSEKPMALTVESCQKMIDAQKKSDAYLMIGQSLRFCKNTAKIKKLIESGEYGKCYRAEFSRYSQTPTWSWNNWILDPKYSGGCIIDMHVHDTDIINYLFGVPKSVRSVMTESKVQRESVFTQYEMDNGMVITSNADWSLPQQFPFEERCIICFEKAVVRILDNNLSIYTDEETIEYRPKENDMLLNEMKEFVSCIMEKRASTISTPESVINSIRIALAEAESAETHKTVAL